MWKYILVSATLASYCFLFCWRWIGLGYGTELWANVTGGNMTAGGNITNITTGGGGNMTAGENMTNAPPGSGD